VQRLEPMSLGQQRREPVVRAWYPHDATAVDELRESLARRLRRHLLPDEIDAHEGIRRSDDIEIDILVDRCPLQTRPVERQLRDRMLLLLREAPREIPPELREDQRNAVLPPTAVSDRILHHDLIERAAILEFHRHGIRDGALLR